MLADVIRSTQEDPVERPESLQLRGAVLSLYAVCVVILSLSPTDHLPGQMPRFPGADKLAHLGIYGLFALLAHWALPSAYHRSRRLGSAVVGAIVGFGFLMEILQAQLTGGARGFEWWDVAANTAGATVGWLLVKLSAIRMMAEHALRR